MVREFVRVWVFFVVLVGFSVRKRGKGGESFGIWLLGLFDLGGGSVFLKWKKSPSVFLHFHAFSHRPNMACSGCGVRRYLFCLLALLPQYSLPPPIFSPERNVFLFCLN